MTPGLVEIADAGDARLDDYRGLTEPARRNRVEAAGGYFLVEGVVALQRLLRSSWSVRSLLVLPRIADRLGADLDAVAAHRPVYVAPIGVLRSVTGFDIHRGALASVDRPAPTHPTPLLAGVSRVVVTEAINDHENLGALFRNAAAFGVGAVLLDPTTADPLYRRSVRVSLGHVLDVPFARLPHLPEGLDLVRGAMRATGGTVLALTPAADAVPLDALDLPALSREPVALVLGAEGPGLTAASLHAADLQVRIPMAPGVDSLNVATAAAVVLSHLCRGDQPSSSAHATWPGSGGTSNVGGRRLGRRKSSE